MRREAGHETDGHYQAPDGHHNCGTDLHVMGYKKGSFARIQPPKQVKKAAVQVKHDQKGIQNHR